MSTLRYALEKLCDYTEAELRDNRPRDKYGPIGRAPVASIKVGDLRGLLMLHTDTTPPVRPSQDQIAEVLEPVLIASGHDDGEERRWEALELAEAVVALLDGAKP